MGWSIEITADKDIRPEDVDTAIKAMPPHFQNDPFGLTTRSSRQEWGWVAAVDVHNPEGNRVGLGGTCGISDHYAEDFAWAFRDQLRALGYQLTVGSLSV